MVQNITAPNTEAPIYTSCFLAGGITNCKDWQKEVIESLKEVNISLFNPRQENFNVLDKSASEKQIKWEYERLESMDIFSMYFCKSDSDQPISMYELGRNIVRMQNRFPSDWEKRIVISVERGYKRWEDVVIQTRLCAPNLYVDIYANPKKHAMRILGADVDIYE